MITFFRRIRKRLLLESSIGKYLLYATGEIILVMVGILLALQVNNWNEERKNKERFNFGLKEVYRQIQYNIFRTAPMQELVGIQIAYMDSLLAGVAFADPAYLPGIIQVLDDNPLGNAGFDTDWVQSYLQFDPNNPKQNELAKYLRMYSANMEMGSKILTFLNFDNTMKNYLRDWNIPVKIERSEGYNRFIRESPKDFYTENNLNNARILIADESFIADLKSIKSFRSKFLENSELITNTSHVALNYLEKYNPDLQLEFEYMEIVGPGTELNSWAEGIPMKKEMSKDGEWVVELNLRDGEVKFRTDNSWTYDWGRSEWQFDKLVFNGSNIPVTEGRYLIRLNIYENSYEITPVTGSGTADRR